VISTDVLGRGSVRGFRLATVIAGRVPAVLALNVSGLDVSQVVGLALAVAASSFCPLLVLGIWWRGLTDLGAAAAGVLVGGGDHPAGRLDGAARLHRAGGGLDRDPGLRTPADIGATMLRLHAPEMLPL
jgi:cation/acetate symporter